MNDAPHAPIQPWDDENRRLMAQVRPDPWENPEPLPRYDLVVIGGGTAGLVSAAAAAGLGARVALVERGLLGGDCLNTGCVPSKALLRSARAVHEARTAAAVGVRSETAVDFGLVMRRLRARRADLAHLDSAERFRALGVHVFFGSASFSSPRSITVARRTLTFRRAVIATGGRPVAPPVAGLADVAFLTSETLFWLTEQPRDLLVVGAGPLGCEMAQAFALLGTTVTLLDGAPRILPREDPDASALLTQCLADAGVRIRTGVTLREVARSGARVEARWDGGTAAGDAILVAAGRVPNLEGLKLDAAGVAASAEGVAVDDHLRTSNRRVFAAGDVCSRFRFTHAADAMARIVVQNALFFGRRRTSALVVPWCTHTFPEVAHVGVAPEEAARRGAVPITIPFEAIDRAVVDEDRRGFVRVHHQGGRVVAATIVAPHAGEIIGHVASLMRRHGSVGDLSADIFPYPTVAEALRKAGDAYRRGSLTPQVRTALERYFAVIRRTIG